MRIPFSPTAQDVERYRRLRALGMELSQKLVKTVPRRALTEIGESIGVVRNGTLVLAREDMTSVVMDCCLYEWLEDGRNLVRQYAERLPAMPETDESYLLNAYLHSKYRLLRLQSTVLDAGAYCDDVLTGEQLFLMDLALSRTLNDEYLLATRTIPLGEYWMTGGAGLPVPQEIVHALRPSAVDENRLLEGRSSIALPIVRACLASGVADHVAYETVGAEPGKPRREPRFNFKRRRRKAD